jgi:hypothetical protein
MKVRVPSCCAANRTFGFVRVTVSFDGDTGKDDPNGEFGRKWEATVVDMTGVSHTIETKRCPVCAAYLVGLEIVDIERTPIRLDPEPARP